MPSNKERLLNELAVWKKDQHQFPVSIEALADRIIAANLLVPESCKWEYNEIDECWDTGCSNKFVFIADGPIENHMKFCPYCGGKLESL